MVIRKLWQSMPSTVKGRLESFLDNEYPLSKFLDRLEHEKQFLLEVQKAPVYHIPEKGEKPTPPPEAKPPMTNPQFEQLQQQLQNLSRKMAQMSRTPTRYSCLQCRTNDHSRSNCPKPYCVYCKNHSHALKDCLKRPLAGACFDCARMNCRRGRPGCPGRSDTSS